MGNNERCRPVLRWLERTALAACCLALPLAVYASGELSIGREYEPVVIPGGGLGDWANSVDLTTINVFRYNSDGSWTAIPFQIDKRRKINLRNNIADPAEGWNYVDVCEYGYFTELSFSIGGAYDVFASNTLGSRDELVFMLKDAGEILAPINAWIDGSSTTRRRITLTDPVTAGATRFVYVYSFPGGVPTSGTAARSTTRYVQYTQDDPIPTGCVAHTCPNCSRQVYPCGTAEGLYGNLGGLESQRVHFLKNWVTDEYHIAEGSSGPYLADMLDRFQYKEATETEENWSDQGVPRMLGVYATNGATEHLVRIVRGIQGASSGRDTTKYEIIYGTQFQTRVNLRVHRLGELLMRYNHSSVYLSDAAAGHAAQLWTRESFNRVSKVPKDDIDGNDFPNREDVDTNYADWTESSSLFRGRFSRFTFESRPITAGSKYYSYQDKTGGGDFGEFGRYLTGLSSTQDGVDDNGDPLNDGGCTTNDPESTVLRFARIEDVTFPKAHVNNPLLPDNVYADDLQKNIDTPMTFADLPEYQFNTNPPPPTPCTPAAPTAVGDTNGAADLTIDKTGCDASLRFRVYRGVGSSGSLFLLADVGTGSALHDLRVTTGSAYRYAVSSYNGTNAESALSATTSVTVTDTTAPSVPAAVVATPGNTKATVSWKQVPDRDLYGYDLYMSTGGGAYEKLNGSAQPAWVDRTWTQVGLTNGLQYCFKIVALDFNGNPSGMSMEGCATPAP